MEFILLGLLLLAIPAAGVVAFFMVLSVRARATAIENRLKLIEARLAVTAPAADAARREVEEEPAPIVEPERDEVPPRDAAEPQEPEQEPEQVPEHAGVEGRPGEPEGFDAGPPKEARAPGAPAIPRGPAPPRPGLEEQLGTRWAVWAGGLALALGGVFLVRYSIEQGYFGPGTRTAFGGLFALALIAAGEWFRRRELAQDLAGIPSAHIPGVLTAVGTLVAFATVYAAYALYGLISPALAFALLGLIAVGTMAAAALHGPAVAALGLVGALANPLLVSTSDPQPWALTLYLAFVVFAAHGLARLRLWRWLAISAAVGAVVWGFAFATLGSGSTTASAAHVLVQTLLAAAFLVVDVHRGTPDETARIDRFASLVLAGFAVLAVDTTAFFTSGGGRAAFAGAVALIHLGVGLSFAPAAVACVLAAAVAAATLALWPVIRFAAGEAPTVLPGAGATPLPEAISLYIGFAVVTSLAILGATLLRAYRDRNLPLPVAGAYVAAATAGSLAILVVAYWRVAAFEKSLPFAAAAALLALLFVLAAGLFRREADQASAAIRIALGTTASAAIAALALGLTFALDKGMLTVAFALAALGTAFVARTVGIPALRWVVGAIGLLILGRMVWNPVITTAGELGTTPILNWLLWGYGVPALSFWYAAQLLARDGRDRVTQLSESLAILFAALLVTFEIRHALYGDPFRLETGHVEAGLFATTGLAFSLAMVRLDGIRPDPVYRVASLLFGAATLLVSFVGLVLFDNPLIADDEPIAGGAVINSLLVAYLLPAVMAAVLAWYAKATRPRWYVITAADLALGLQFLYMIAEIRRLFQGPWIRFGEATSEAEVWTYSAALIVVGVVLLVIGLARNFREARLLSAVYIVSAVLKVFLFDLENLEGIMRALSFIGLGIALVGIGLLYQRLLFRGRPPDAPEVAPQA